jgi:hypothetical protein
VKLDNVWVLHALQHLQLIVHHLLISLDILLQDDFDSDLALGAVGLAHDAVCAGAQCLSEAVSGSAIVVSACEEVCAPHGKYGLAVIAVGLAVQLVEHVCHYDSALVWRLARQTNEKKYNS